MKYKNLKFISVEERTGPDGWCRFRSPDMTELFLHAGPGSYRTMLAIVPGAIAEVIEGDTGQRPKVKPLFTAGSRADRPPHARRSRIRRYAIA